MSIDPLSNENKTLLEESCRSLVNNADCMYLSYPKLVEQFIKQKNGGNFKKSHIININIYVFFF